MITSTFHGELGNNLFQLAACLALKDELQVDYELINAREAWVSNNERPLEIQKLFNYNFNFVPQHTNQYESYVHNDCIEGTSPNYNFAYTELPKRDNLSLRGYFQSEKYFVNIKDKLINEYFLPKTEVQDYIKDKYSSILPNSIAVHFRAGGDRSKCLDLFPLTSPNYYQNAIETICNKADIENILVFSDNIGLAKDMFPEGVVFIENESNITDLIFMSMCSHNILGNSTFSWWSAYLNKNPNKIVVAPKTEWFGGGLSTLNIDDLFPNNWITL